MGVLTSSFTGCIKVSACKKKKPYLQLRYLRSELFFKAGDRNKHLLLMVHSLSHIWPRHYFIPRPTVEATGCVVIVIDEKLHLITIFPSNAHKFIVFQIPYKSSGRSSADSAGLAVDPLI